MSDFALVELFNCIPKILECSILRDFNPDETVRDKMSRLGEVKNCRGFGKLLKGIAIASKASGKPAHEFMGLLSIPLKVHLKNK